MDNQKEVPDVSLGVELLHGTPKTKAQIQIEGQRLANWLPRLWLLDELHARFPHAQPDQLAELMREVRADPNYSLATKNLVIEYDKPPVDTGWDSSGGDQPAPKWHTLRCTSLEADNISVRADSDLFLQHLRNIIQAIVSEAD